jgi:putative transposase
LPEIITAIKVVKQSFCSTPELMQMMDIFRHMVNHCIRLGLEYDVSTLKQLSKICYPELGKYNIISYYKLHAISRAAGILANRKQSIKRGYATKTPYLKKGNLVSCYGFKVVNCVLKVPTGDRQYFDIPLNNYTKGILSDPAVTVRSFTLTDNTVSICYCKEVAEIECATIAGVDRNLRNLTVGTHENVMQYDLSKAVDIAENTRSIIKSFKRNDVRIRKRLYSKYGKRRKNRIAQLLHYVSKAVVQKAKQEKSAIAFEDIRRIRKLYQRGNHQGLAYRGRMNGWSFAEIKRLITYKAAWEGVPVIQLSVKETRGTSQLCPRCGKRLQEGRLRRRELYCEECNRWLDRDVVAVMNIGRKGAEVFQRSQGDASEAMKGNPAFAKEPVILRVDASKLSHYPRT